MDVIASKPTKTFKPRHSSGRAWLVLMAVVIIAIAIAPALIMGLSSSSTIVTLTICSLVAIAFLVLAFWFPTMRYELSQGRLTLRYGPVLTYRIPLAEIRTIRHRNLSLTIWSTIRFPGIALFQVPYADVGNVKMCATAALNNILLIETEKEKFGLTPADEEAFVAALRSQMEQK
jgi:PH (Pleckstrin Homology) domain-containing protein